MEKNRPTREERTYGAQVVWMAVMLLCLFGAVSVESWMVQLALCFGVVVSVSGLASVMFAAWTPLLNDLNNHMLESQRRPTPNEDRLIVAAIGGHSGDGMAGPMF